MDFWSILLLAVGLAMDCFAVSVVQGVSRHQWHPKALLMATIFGGFHFGMPLIGYGIGSFLAQIISRYAPWVALLLLCWLGIKMIWESYHHTENHTHDWTLTSMLLLALATSIDVLATGVVFVSYPQWLMIAVTTTGIVTALFSLLGYIIGVYVGKLKFNAELLGGIVLILLGVKIFIEGVCL